MSLLKSNSVQIGQSTTGTNNFTLSVPSSPDGTIKLARGNSGATTADILSVNASGAITGATISSPTISGATITSSTVNGGSITSGTAVASTSGTAIDFTGIPSWVKIVKVVLNGVSVSGTSNILIQIGISSGIEITGYSATACSVQLSATGVASFTSGFGISPDSAADQIHTGIFTLASFGSNIWASSSVIKQSSRIVSSAGIKTLGGTLDRVRITTVNGTDTFDLGSINIMYEG